MREPSVSSLCNDAKRQSSQWAERIMLPKVCSHSSSGRIFRSKVCSRQAGQNLPNAQRSPGRYARHAGTYFTIPAPHSSADQIKDRAPRIRTTQTKRRTIFPLALRLCHHLEPCRPPNTDSLGHIKLRVWHTIRARFLRRAAHSRILWVKSMIWVRS